MRSPIPKPDCCIVTADYNQNERITHGTLTLIIDPDWGKELRAVNNAIIANLHPSYKGELRIGDKIYGNHMLLDIQDRFSVEGVTYNNVPLEEIYLYFRNGEMKMCEGKYLCEPIYNDYKPSSGIILPFIKKKDKMATIVNAPDNDKDFKVGDVVIYMKDADYDIEIEGKEYYCIWDKRCIHATA